MTTQDTLRELIGQPGWTQNLALEVTGGSPIADELAQEAAPKSRTPRPGSHA